MAQSVPDEVRSLVLEEFYRDVLFALGEHARRRGATAHGAATVVKRVAREHGLAIAERLPLPRLTRAELDELGASNSGYARGGPLRRDRPAEPSGAGDAGGRNEGTGGVGVGR
jgi:hypothetical protein